MNYSYTWMHNGSTIIPTSSGSKKSILNITSIGEEDIGDYICFASNGIQPDGMGNFTVFLGGNRKIFLLILDF